MKIEVGKSYLAEGGWRAEITESDESNIPYRARHITTKGDRIVWHRNDGSPEEFYKHNPDLYLIAEWTDTPTLWKDMTPIEKGALLLAHQEGKVIERSHNQGTTWKEKTNGLWHENHAYRVKPETTVETVTLYGAAQYRWKFNPTMAGDTHRITFNLIDGKPDPSSIRMEELW